MKTGIKKFNITNKDIFGLSNNIPNSTKMIKISYKLGNSNKKFKTFKIFKTKEQAEKFIKNNGNLNIIEIGIGIFNNDSIYLNNGIWNYENNSNLELEYKQISDLSKINTDFGKIKISELKINSIVILEKLEGKYILLSFGNTDYTMVPNVSFNVITLNKDYLNKKEYLISLSDESNLDITTLNEGMIDFNDMKNIIEELDSELGNEEAIYNILLTEATIKSEQIYKKNILAEIEILTPDGNTIELSVDYNFDKNISDDIIFNYKILSGNIIANGIDESEFLNYIKNKISLL